MSFSGLIKDKRVLVLLVVTLAAICLAYFGGVKFGIDFSGGTRIPVLLEQPASADVMDQMIETIKTRVSTFGLMEVKVRARGDDEILVEIPSSDEETVRQTERVLEKQGVYIGVVDGKIAITGEDIYSGTISHIPASQLNMQTGGWGVGFSVSKEGAERFADIAKGKANYPLFMFLDRPSDAFIFISREQLLGDANITDEDAITLVNDALRLENDQIKFYIIDDFDSYKEELKPETNRSKAIVSKEAPDKVKNYLSQAGYELIEREDAEMYPKYSISPTGYSAISEWKAIGLMSAPRLVAGVTTGTINYRYVITGYGEGETAQEKISNAKLEAREIESILKGGSLPIGISIGSKTSIPAPLGSKFLEWSIIGALAALLVIGVTVAVRYKSIALFIPIMAVSFAEIIILVCIIGFFTIDLGAFAGIIAAVGTSVDAQIVITDELLKKDGSDIKSKLKRAFAIVTRSRTIVIVAMLPLLLFSGLVEIIGFATSTILGALLGILLSRHSYAAFVEHLILNKKQQAEKMD